MTLYLIGYSGATCTRDILVNSRGFSGIDLEMQRRLLALFEASPIVDGYYSLGFGEGWRSDTAQAAEFLRRHFLDPNGKLVYLGRRYTLKPGMAPLAPPDLSYHQSTTRSGKALAADLVGNLGWAHENVARFGLMNFRATGAKPEPWHHQPVEIPASRRNYSSKFDPLPSWPLPDSHVWPTIGPGSTGPLVTAVRYFLLIHANQAEALGPRPVEPVWDDHAADAWEAFAEWMAVAAPRQVSQGGTVTGNDWNVIAYISQSWDGLYSHGFPRAA